MCGRIKSSSHRSNTKRSPQYADAKNCPRFIRRSFSWDFGTTTSNRAPPLSIASSIGGLALRGKSSKLPNSTSANPFKSHLVKTMHEICRPKDEAKRVCAARGFSSLQEWRKQNRRAIAEFQSRASAKGADRQRFHTLISALESDFNTYLKDWTS